MIRFLTLALFAFLLPAAASAATLYLSPSTGTYTAGKAFTVSVYASSPDEAMNAVAADISVPSDLFSIVSASSVGSVINFWVEQPVVSGNTISFEGVVLNPGYQGGGAKVASFVLLPKGSGTGAVTFSSASVLANDGKGTDILDSASGGSFTIREAVSVPAAAPQAPPAPPATDADDEPAPLEAPRIVDYDAELAYGDLVQFRGVTYENAVVEFKVRREGETVATEYADSNSLGDFSVIITKKLEPGTYAASARVTDENGRMSPESEPVVFTITGGVSSLFAFLTSELLAIIGVIALALIALGAVLHAYGWHRLLAVTRDLHTTQTETAGMTRQVFGLLKKDLSAHVRAIRDAGTTRILTAEELAFLKDFEDELAEAETALNEGAKPKRSRKKS